MSPDPEHVDLVMLSLPNECMLAHTTVIRSMWFKSPASQVQSCERTALSTVLLLVKADRRTLPVTMQLISGQCFVSTAQRV